jgi:hypothetical protein
VVFCRLLYCLSDMWCFVDYCIVCLTSDMWCFVDYCIVCLTSDMWCFVDYCIVRLISDMWCFVDYCLSFSTCFWLLCCLSLDVRFLITTFVSSNYHTFSESRCVTVTQHEHQLI